jgi:hypothetical protein
VADYKKYIYRYYQILNASILPHKVSTIAPPIEVKIRRAIISDNPSVLTDIYHDDVNLAIWQRPLPDSITLCIQDLIAQKPAFRTLMAVTPSNINENISECFDGIDSNKELCEHISLLVDMFCTLFDLKEAGLRLKLLDSPMCPKFHVDKVPCRLVTTFYGSGTEWLPHNAVNRNKLGSNSSGLQDESSGIMLQSSDIQQLSSGDIALLKGESWHNNEHAGLVHRSPALEPHEHRLLLTLDFIN